MKLVNPTADGAPPWYGYALRLFDGERVKVNLQFEIRDFWVGVFWRVSVLPYRPWVEPRRFRLFHLYVCLVPMVPLHVTVLKETP